MNYPIVITTLLALFLSAVTGLAEAERDALKRQIASLQTAIEQNEEKIEKIGKAISVLEAKSPRVGPAEQKQIREQLASYRDQMKQLKTVVEQMRKRIVEYQKRLDNLQE